MIIIDSVIHYTLCIPFFFFPHKWSLHHNDATSEVIILLISSYCSQSAVFKTSLAQFLFLFQKKSHITEVMTLRRGLATWSFKIIIISDVDKLGDGEKVSKENKIKGSIRQIFHALEHRTPSRWH